MEHLPSADKAERNQKRKLAFVPMWPLLGVLVVVVLVVVLTTR